MQLFEFLFPDVCPICLKPVIPKGGFLHEECKGKLKFVARPFCLKCGRAIEDEAEEYCSSCRKTKFVFDAGRCTFVYHSDIGKAIKWVKEEGTRELVDFFGKATVKRHESFLRSFRADAIVPVPLTKGKQRARGFNQAELFAESLSECLGIPVGRFLVKIKKTRDQKGLNRAERVQNLEGAFKACLPAEHMPGCVLLADDIYTTGSTVNACAAALKNAGVDKVYFLCIAAGTSDV